MEKQNKMETVDEGGKLEKRKLNLTIKIRYLNLIEMEMKNAQQF